MTRIERSWAATVGWAVAGCGFAVGAYYAWCWGGFFGVLLSLVSALITFTCAWISARESGRASCPQCQAPLAGLDAKQAERFVYCKKCQRYIVYRHGQLSAATDEISEFHSFRVKLPSRVVWPDSCCVCNAPATRSLPISGKESQAGRNLALGVVGLAAGSLVVRTGGGVGYTVEVPHCDEHTAGAKLDVQGENEMELALRSHRYWRAFVDLNIGQTLPTSSG